MTGNAHLSLRVTNSRCRCSGCHQYFNSVGAFDKHRNGKAEERHCWNVEEMQSAGMVMNQAGYWCVSANDFEWSSAA